MVLMFDVETADGISFCGIADEDLTITELTRLAPGQTLPMRYLPAVMDHYAALARDADPTHVQGLYEQARLDPVSLVKATIWNGRHRRGCCRAGRREACDPKLLFVISPAADACDLARRSRSVRRYDYRPNPARPRKARSTVEAANVDQLASMYVETLRTRAQLRSRDSWCASRSRSP
ncbi:hypothetical protein [Rhodococcus sp. 24CO]|uniref:hypothetical protein n=1 Tax=Rhodococcus sp. 24CO TaxID=3117460 RepID=UPI003D34E420